MISRIKSPWFDRFQPFCATCQLVLEMNSDSAVTSFVKYLKDTVYALRIRKRGEYIERHNDVDQIPSYTFTKQINDSFVSLEEISNYVHEKIPLNFEEAEATVISSPKNSLKKYVALNIPHYFADGKYCVYLVDQFLNPNSVKSLSGLPDFPYNKFEAYKKYFENAPKNVKDDLHDEKLTRFFTNDIILNSKNEEFDKFVTLHFRADELKNSIIQNNGSVLVKNFTEALYLSNYFAICAHENKLLKSFGVINVVDIKKYFDQGPISFANAIEVGFISPHVDHISPEKMNIEIGHKLRKSLTEKLNNYEQFAVVASAKYNQSLPKLKGITTEFSNIGGFHIRKPITNLWFSLNIKCLDRETVSNMGFSVIRDDFDSYDMNERENKSRNDMVLRYRYSPKKLSLVESTKIAKCIEFYLKNISLSDHVAESFEKVKNFYNSF